MLPSSTYHPSQTSAQSAAGHLLRTEDHTFVLIHERIGHGFVSTLHFYRLDPSESLSYFVFERTGLNSATHSSWFASKKWSKAILASNTSVGMALLIASSLLKASSSHLQTISLSHIFLAIVKRSLLNAIDSTLISRFGTILHRLLMIEPSAAASLIQSLLSATR